MEVNEEITKKEMYLKPKTGTKKEMHLKLKTGYSKKEERLIKKL